MAEGQDTNETVNQSEITKAERFGLLRSEITKKLPKAHDTLIRSGLETQQNLKDPELRKKINRTAINIAGEKVRDQYNSETDSELTDLWNRKGYTRRLEEESRRAARIGYPFTLVKLDANDLKRLNDSGGGHAAGDKLLINIAESLSMNTREFVDTVARWGGDEFAVILSNTTLDGARVWWNRVNEEFKKRGISIGAGASELTVDDLRNGNLKEILESKEKRADLAQYKAKAVSKSQGENTFVTERDLTPEDLEVKLKK